MMIRTRFAPSPTGFLHIGGARTALFSWAYARRHAGSFILRIEDTDLARSTPEAVQAILDGMQWLGLNYDEGPFYQTQRMPRYRAVIEEMLAAGSAYRCYMTPDELDRLREEQRAQGLKPRYDGRWRPEPGKELPAPPPGVAPVVRFRNPIDGDVSWDDLVKGRITISNRELDDLIIARPDGTPTYNFCVVVDDWDMQISHVLRGDDHVNNTPRQINILRALGAELPLYGHVPMILGPDGDKLSKRHGAVSVMQYEEAGYLPEAMINYLSRLGWSHGDDELFDRAQLVQWFDGEHLAKSPAQWDAAKLNWVNAQYIKAMADEALAPMVAAQMARLGVQVTDGRLVGICGLFKDRCDTTVALAQWACGFYAPVKADPAERERLVTEAVRPAVALLGDRLTVCEWTRAAIAAAIKEVLAATGLKMPQLAMAARVLLLGTSQTPSLDAVIELFLREEVIARLRTA